MEIRPVESKADLRQFVEFPYRHYRADTTWVPPLRSEQWAQFDPRRNPMLEHCEYALFLLWDDGRPLGRVSAFGPPGARDLGRAHRPLRLLRVYRRRGRAVGLSLALPSINALLRGLKGRLFPFGWLKLLFGLAGLREYRLWALGVTPEYQGKAVDALLYAATYEALGPCRPRVEINYVLEDNVRMNNALQNLEVRPLRRYRVYEMPI